MHQSGDYLVTQHCVMMTNSWWHSYDKLGIH